MDIKSFLKQYEIQDRKAKRLLREYEKERSMIDALHSPLTNPGEPHGSEISQRTENEAIRLADKLLEYEDARLLAIEKRQRVFDVVNAVPGIMGDVLIERYINLKKGHALELALNYSYRNISRIEKKAISYISEKLSNNVLL